MDETPDIQVNVWLDGRELGVHGHLFVNEGEDRVTYALRDSAVRCKIAAGILDMLEHWAERREGIEH
jgi:hypothetical protein